VDMGPHKNRRRVRPAPQGRAYREQRHFCHITVLLSNDERETAAAGRGKAGVKTSPAGKPKTSDKGKNRPARAGETAAAGAASKRGAAKKAAEPGEVKVTKAKASDSSAAKAKGGDSSAAEGSAE